MRNLGLYKPKYAGNIGSVARAAKNMGITGIVVVGSKEFDREEMELSVFFATFLAGEFLNIVKRTALYFGRKKYCKTAIEDQANLKAIREAYALNDRRPDHDRVQLHHRVTGCRCHGHHRRLGKKTAGGCHQWPVDLRDPDYLHHRHQDGRKTYVHVFCRWMVQVVLEKILGDDVRMLSESGSVTRMLTCGVTTLIKHIEVVRGQ